jgi:hypothetical protein
MSFKYLLNTVALLPLLSLPMATQAADNKLAVKKFEAALSNCEKGLQAALPKSSGSLKILQLLYKHYERDRDEALGLDASLKEAKHLRYTGKFFVERSFDDIFQSCERDFSAKIGQAENEVNTKEQNRRVKQKEQQPQVDALLKKLNTAMQQVAVAVNQHCVGYLRSPTPQIAAVVYKPYLAAKAAALEAYPEIVKQLHDSVIIEPEEERQVTKTVQAWFRYCDDVFKHPASMNTVEKQIEKVTEKPAEAAPVSPMTTTPTVATPTDVKPAVTSANNLPSIEDEGPMPQPVPMVTPPVSVVPAVPATTSTSTVATPAPTTPTVLTPPTVEVKPSVTPTPTAPIPAAATTSETVDDPKVEYQKLVNTVDGDRQKILKDEKRLPDYINDEDNDYKKADHWQYESEDGNKCTVYIFAKDGKATKKPVNGECPPFK